MIDPKDVTIIIPHLGATSEQCYALDQCLESLRETFSGEIFVVNNGNNLCGHDDIVDCVLRQQGQNRAVNIAVAANNTPWIFITNDDMVYAPGWFERLVEPIKPMYMVSGDHASKIEYKPGEIIVTDDVNSVMGLSDILCISPRLVEPRPGAPTFEVFFAGGAGGDFNKENWLGYAEEHTERDYMLQTGFNFPLLIKWELWDTIGGYDINYDPWSSNGDSDLQAKIHLAGVQPYQNPNSVVYHFGMTSGTSHPSNRPSWEKNWHYFIEKWGFERASSPDVWNSVNIIDYDKLKYHPDWEGKYAKQ